MGNCLQRHSRVREGRESGESPRRGGTRSQGERGDCPGMETDCPLRSVNSVQALDRFTLLPTLGMVPWFALSRRGGCDMRPDCAPRDAVSVRLPWIAAASQEHRGRSPPVSREAAPLGVQGQYPAHTGFIPEFRMDSTQEGQCTSLY